MSKTKAKQKARKLSLQALYSWDMGGIDLQTYHVERIYLSWDLMPFSVASGIGIALLGLLKCIVHSILPLVVSCVCNTKLVARNCCNKLSLAKKNVLSANDARDICNEPNPSSKTTT